MVQAMPSFDMERCLKGYFGHSSFRPSQKEIITKILDGKDCLVVMATGSGKSICYQLPPLISKKTAIVISPLISLMQDQVMALKLNGIKAEFLSSAQADGTVMSRAMKGEFSILYMTPEKACNASDSLWSSLVQKGVCLLAVDEAHCISEWGHDFRTEYKNLHSLRQFLPEVPFVALTATATEKVRADIVTSLYLKDPFTMITTFDRPNIFYGVKKLTRTDAFREELAQEVLGDLKKGGSSIVYCTTIRDVEEVVDSLVRAGVNAQGYHGQMAYKQREAVHRAFVSDELQIIVATVAFGMGIDKPDIRRVIHYGCPKSLESYYQESGRCGRDGLPSVCWLYYTRSDFTKGDFYVAEARTEARRKAVMDAYFAAQKYCSLSTCRRKFILEYFGENVSVGNCGKCDNCTRSEAAQEKDVGEEAHLLLTAVKLCGGHFGINLPIDVLRGSCAKRIVERGLEKCPVHGLGQEKSSNWWKSLADQLLLLGYLKETMRDKYRLVNIGPKAAQFLSKRGSYSKHSLILPLTQEMIEEENKQNGLASQRMSSAETVSSHLHPEGFTEVEIKLLNLLLDARAELAKRNSTAPYAICNEKTLQRLAKLRPSTLARLRNIDGVNQWLVDQHGEELLSIIKRLSEEINLPLDTTENCVPSYTSSRRTEQTNISPAKLEAWKMWQGGLSFAEIANLPERPKPIKEDTVVEYILECVRAGYEINWVRFCKETGFIGDTAEAIETAILKVGSKERLKPIKDEVPASISYVNIRTYLLLQDLGVPIPNMNLQEGTPVSQEQVLKVDDENIPSDAIINDNIGEGSTDLMNPPWMIEQDRATAAQRRRIPAWQHGDLNNTGKRPKPDVDDASIVQSINLSDNDILQWIGSHNGVSMEDITSNFPNASQTLLSEIISRLHDEFCIYSQNGTFKVM